MNYSVDLTTGMKWGSEAIPTSTPLCKHHYHVVYDELQRRQKQYATCGTWLNQCNHRPCLKPDMIQMHLQEMTVFQVEIHSHDCVCLACYKSYLVILKENKLISSNSDLEQLIGMYSQQIPCMEQMITTRM